MVSLKETVLSSRLLSVPHCQPHPASGEEKPPGQMEDPSVVSGPCGASNSVFNNRFIRVRCKPRKKRFMSASFSLWISDPKYFYLPLALTQGSQLTRVQGARPSQVYFGPDSHTALAICPEPAPVQTPGPCSAWSEKHTECLQDSWHKDLPSRYPNLTKTQFHLQTLSCQHAKHSKL